MWPFIKRSFLITDRHTASIMRIAVSRAFLYSVNTAMRGAFVCFSGAEVLKSIELA